MERLVEPLPPRARLFHIGLAKTGTTALQHAAQRTREELLRLGVRYPGGGVNHREAVSALMGRRWGWIGPGASVPPMRHWDRLMTEVEADEQRRIWVSHEFASESDDESAARFAEALGERLHVVITLRPFASMLVSSFQQYLKGGTHRTFENWLEGVLAEPPDTSVTPSFHRRNDQGGVVRRWVAAAGAENVTLLVVDKRHPDRLTRAFEDLLDLPRGLLVGEDPDGLQANRSMSRQECELLRQVNLGLRGQDVEWRSYERLLREGGIARVLATRTPAEGEAMLQLPRWAAERAERRGDRFVEELAASGARVVGDLAALGGPVRGVDELDPAPVRVDVDLAADFVLGTLSAALERGPDFAVPPPPPEPAPAPAPAPVKLATVGGRDLVRELARRVRRRALRPARWGPSPGPAVESRNADEPAPGGPGPARRRGSSPCGVAPARPGAQSRVTWTTEGRGPRQSPRRAR